MSKLIDALANLPESEVEDMVAQYFANQIFGIASEDTPEKRDENIQQLNAIRNHALVAVLSDTERGWVFDACDTAERLISIDDDAEDD